MSRTYKPIVSAIDHAHKRYDARQSARARELRTGATEYTGNDVVVTASTAHGKTTQLSSNDLTQFAAHRKIRTTPSSISDRVSSDPFFDELPHGKMPGIDGNNPDRTYGVIKDVHRAERDYQGSKYI
jgi:hypothetical protein